MRGGVGVRGDDAGLDPYGVPQRYVMLTCPLSRTKRTSFGCAAPSSVMRCSQRSVTSCVTCVGDANVASASATIADLNIGAVEMREHRR